MIHMCGWLVCYVVMRIFCIFIGAELDAWSLLFMLVYCLNLFL